MSDDLSPESRALLGAARGADDPGAGDRDRVRARVLAAIGAGAAGTAGGATAKAAPAAGGAALAKLALLLLALAGVATGAYLALRSAPTNRVATADPVPVPAPAPVAAADPVPVPDPAPVAAADPDPEIIVEVTPDDPPSKPRTHKPKPAAETSEPPPTPTPSPADSLQQERALLAKATAALRAGDPDAALAALGEHQKKFPHGVLEQERAASTVLALCATGRTSEGKKARDRFLTAWPRSVHAARVGAACSD